jgi:hypothetical protein
MGSESAVRNLNSFGFDVEGSEFSTFRSRRNFVESSGDLGTRSGGDKLLKILAGKGGK